MLKTLCSIVSDAESRYGLSVLVARAGQGKREGMALSSTCQHQHKSQAHTNDRNAPDHRCQVDNLTQFIPG
jgi:hypothetical protein